MGAPQIMSRAARACMLSIYGDPSFTGPFLCAGVSGHAVLHVGPRAGTLKFTPAPG
jgi:hypothetical protein